MGRIGSTSGRAAPARAVALGLAGCLALVAGCGGGRGDQAVAQAPVAESPARGTDGLASPPSAGAPRADLAGAVPDTVRPEASDTTSGTVVVLPGRSEEPVDVGAVASTYRHYYVTGYNEQGSRARGAIDPRLAAQARSETATEFGFDGDDGWRRMVATLSPSGRARLADRMAVVDAALARQLHAERGDSVGAERGGTR